MTTYADLQVAERPTLPVAKAEAGQSELGSLIRLAIEKGADVASIGELLKMKREFDADQAKKAFVAAFSEFKKLVPTIIKNKLVEFETAKGKTSYTHATLDNVCDKLAPALAAHGISHRWRTDQQESIIKVTCVLTHVGGHTEENSLKCIADQSGGKNPIQAVGSTVTYLERYSLLAAVGVAVRGMDDDGRQGEQEDPFVSKAEVKELTDGLNAVHADWEKFFDHFKIQDLTELKASQLGKAREMIEKKRARR